MPVFVTCANPQHPTQRFATVALAESYSLAQAIMGDCDHPHRVLDADQACRQLEQEIASAEFATAMCPTFPFPQDVTYPELAEWLDGAGFDLATSIDLDGFASHVFTVRVPTAGWPAHVGVVVDADGSYVATAHYDDDEGLLLVSDHDYERGCHCDACHEEGELRAEDAALKAVGL